MIYTVTLNPSLDYVVRVGEFQPGQLHRSQSEDIFVGGKGINVSTVLKELETESVALGFIAGFTGNEILHRLTEMGISSDFIPVSQGMSRINVKLKSDVDVETEINGQGPVIGPVELEQFYETLNKLNLGDFLVLSGSVPKSLPNAEHVYSEICGRVKASEIKLVIDAEGDLLRNTLCAEPFLIKPNRQELEKLFDTQIKDITEVYTYAARLHKEGAGNVLVSLGEEGALLIDEYGTAHRQAAIQGKVLNSVGAGDSMVAGFLAHLSGAPVKGRSYKSEDYDYALRLAVAAGSAGAFSLGLPDRKAVEEVLTRMEGQGLNSVII